MTPLCSWLSPGATGGPLPRPLLQTPSPALEPFNSRWFSGVKHPWQDLQLRAQPFLGLQEHGEDGRKGGGWLCVRGLPLAPSCTYSLIWSGFFSPLAHPHVASQGPAGPPPPTPPLLSVCSLGSRGFIPTDACPLSILVKERRQKMLGLGAPGQVAASSRNYLLSWSSTTQMAPLLQAHQGSGTPPEAEHSESLQRAPRPHVQAVSVVRKNPANAWPGPLPSSRPSTGMSV